MGSAGNGLVRILADANWVKTLVQENTGNSTTGTPTQREAIAQFYWRHQLLS
jgi:hypothetical protein